MRAKSKDKPKGISVGLDHYISLRPRSMRIYRIFVEIHRCKDASEQDICARPVDRRLSHKKSSNFDEHLALVRHEYEDY